jgi:hypothetical protein
MARNQPMLQINKKIDRKERIEHKTPSYISPVAGERREGAALCSMRLTPFL